MPLNIMRPFQWRPCIKYFAVAAFFLVPAASAIYWWRECVKVHHELGDAAVVDTVFRVNISRKIKAGQVDAMPAHINELLIIDFRLLATEFKDHPAALHSMWEVKRCLQEQGAIVPEDVQSMFDLIPLEQPYPGQLYGER